MSDAEPIPVLIFHAVRDDPAPGHEHWTVSRRRFAEHVRAVVASGRTAVDVPALAEALSGRATLPDRPVVLTFDDGWDDTLPACAELASNGLRSTVYVTTGLLGRPFMLDVPGLQDLAAMEDVEVGGHGVDHLHLDELPQDAARWQVSESRARLAQLAGCDIRSFAYPHGAHDRTVRAAVVDAGYSSAVAVKDAFSHAGDDPFAIARWTVTADIDAQRLGEVLEGRSVPLAPARERPRTTVYRAVRRARRRLGLGTADPFAFA